MPVTAITAFPTVETPGLGYGVGDGISVSTGNVPTRASDTTITIVLKAIQTSQFKGSGVVHFSTPDGTALEMP